MQKITLRVRAVRVQPESRNCGIAVCLSICRSAVQLCHGPTKSYVAWMDLFKRTPPHRPRTPAFGTDAGSKVDAVLKANLRRPNDAADQHSRRKEPGRALALPASQEQAAASARLPSPCRIDWHSAPVRPFVYLCAINFLLPDPHQSFGSRTSEFSYCGWVGQGLLVRGNWPRGQDAHGEAACETWARWRNFKWLKKSGTQRL